MIQRGLGWLERRPVARLTHEQYAERMRDLGSWIGGRRPIPPEPDRQPMPEPEPLTAQEKLILYSVRVLGEQEALARLMFSGPYQWVWDAIQRKTP